jgi:cytochrome b561
MPLRNTAEAYGSLARFLHWAIVLLILPQYFLVEGADEFPEVSQQAAQLMGLHKSLGFLVLVLALVRIGWKVINRPHPAPIGDVAWQRKAAAAGHGMLYLLIVLQPLTGWIMVSAGDYSFSLFGWLTVPPLVRPNHDLHEALEEVHEVLFWLTVAVATVHVAAALFHHWVLRDDTLRRMLPFTRFQATRPADRA